MKKLFTFIFLVSFAVSLHGLDFFPSQDPKAYVTHIRFQYNDSYHILEAEGKISSSLSIYKAPAWEWGLLGSITLYIHFANNFLGTYPVDNLIGFIGFYGFHKRVFGVNHLDLIFYPMIHESTHLVDGYDRGNIYTDKVLDSNEYIGFDLRYRINTNLSLYGGAILFMYFPPSTFYDSPRRLLTRIRIGEEWSIPFFSKVRYYLGSDFALFYENTFQTAINIGTGLDFSNSRLLVHFEHQYGLGQDFRELHTRIGIEIQIK